MITVSVVVVLGVVVVLLLVVVLSPPPPQADIEIPASMANASVYVGLNEVLECVMNLLLK